MTDSSQIDVPATVLDLDAQVELDTITVLHIDDDADFLELAKTFLKRSCDAIEVITETNVDDALAQLEDGHPIDCIVSDYQIPGKDGLEFLRVVREDFPHLPFILFTGKGSEEVASEAISAGVTDYLQKEKGTDQYEILANRIENVVAGYRLQHSSAERERRLETLTSNLPGIVYQCYNEEGWPMVSVEGECQELTGYSSGILERGEVTYGADLIHPQDRNNVWEAVQEAVATDEPFEVTYRILTADKTEKWVWERGRVAYSESDGTNILEGFVTDITSRKEGGEHELAQSPSRLSTLFNNTTECVAYCEFPGDSPIILDVNPAFEDTFGFDTGELVGEELEEAASPQERREEVHQLSQQVKRGETVETEIRCQTADGVRTFDYRAVPIDAEDETTKMYALFTDMTERTQDKQ